MSEGVQRRCNFEDLLLASTPVTLEAHSRVLCLREKRTTEIVSFHKANRMAGQQREQFPAWVRSPEQTAAHYGVSLEVGLTSEQVEEARRSYGWNELEKAPGKPLWKLVLEQFDDMLVKVRACFPLFVFCMPGTFLMSKAPIHACGVQLAACAAGTVAGSCDIIFASVV